MKNIILLVCATITLSLTAQSKYETAMTKALEQYKSAKTIEELVTVLLYLSALVMLKKTSGCLIITVL